MSAHPLPARDARRAEHATDAAGGTAGAAAEATRELVQLLVPLAERGLSLTRLESRPTGEPRTARFVLELEHRAGEVVRPARAAARPLEIVDEWDLPGPRAVRP